MEGAAPDVWLVDGYNALCTALTGGAREEWWSAARRDELVVLAGAFDDPRAEIWIAFDGTRRAEPAPDDGGRVRWVFSASADAWLVARVRAHPEPRRLAVVTADRRVGGRARRHGARVVHPRDFVARCRGESPRGKAHSRAASLLNRSEYGRNSARSA